MHVLIILNDPAYGTERSYNGLRLAAELAKRPEESVRVFLLGDAASCAKSGQTTPQGYYNLGRMLQLVSGKQGEIGVCGSCMEARGIKDAELLAGTRPSTLEELTVWVLWADRVVVF